MKSLGTDNQVPNIRKNLQQISRNEDMHMIQAAISINSEICIWWRQKWLISELLKVLEE